MMMAKFRICLVTASSCVCGGFEDRQISASSFAQLGSSQKPVSNSNNQLESIRDVETPVEHRVWSNKTTSRKMEKVQKQLEKACCMSNEVRRRVTTWTLGVGSVLAFFCATMGVISGASGDVYGLPQYYFAATTFFISLMGLGALPNDVLFIRFTSLFFTVLFFLLGLRHTYSSANWWFVERHIHRGYDGGDTIYQCGSDLPDVGCALFSSKEFVYGVCSMITSILSSRNLTRHDNTRFYDPSQPKGFRFKDSVFKIPARKALNRIWLVGRLGCAIPGVATLVYMVIMHVLQDDIPFYQEKYLPANLCLGVAFTIAPLILSDERRRRIMGFLTSMIVESEASSAASIAALLGGLNASDGLALAQQKFRSISFAHLSKEDFVKNLENECDKNKLFGLTQAAKLGRCDVFLSHSWSDDGPKKYEILKQWAHDFEMEHNRTPNIWLDKACIDQTDIENDLMCLPMFLAGCESLLVIAGSTYTSRLWCILEIFTFLKMGGDVQRVTVLPINMCESDAKKMFDMVDVNKCKCFLEKDQEKLLGIIEQGFGNFDEFNEIIRHVFKQRISMHIPNHLLDKIKGSLRSLHLHRSSRIQVLPSIKNIPTPLDASGIH